MAGLCRWVPSNDGTMTLLAADGTVLFTISSAGAATGSAGATTSLSGLLTFTSPATTGRLRVPVVTEVERDALDSPATGTVVYNSTTNKLNVRVAAAWEAVTSA